MLAKEEVVALFTQYESTLRSYVFGDLRQGARRSEMYAVFMYVFDALDCLKNNTEHDFKGVPGFLFEGKSLSILGDSKNPLEIIERFIMHYSPDTLALLFAEDARTPQRLSALNEFYAELSVLYVPKPIILYKGGFYNELAIKFPTQKAHDNFVALMGEVIGQTYADKPTVLFLPGTVQKGHLVATFPNNRTREEAINLLGLTGATMTRQGDNQLIINDPVMLQVRQNVALVTPEHLYKDEQKQAYQKLNAIAKGIASYAHCPHSFFNGLPNDLNKKIALTVAEVCDVELDSNIADKVISRHIGS